VALNFRTWVGRDVLLWPLGTTIRALWKVPGLGPWLARRRLATRLGWQANRLSPAEVVPATSGLVDIQRFRSGQRRPFGLGRTGSTTAIAESTFDGINPSHWWLVARVAGDANPGTGAPAQG
jgi:hypothetical protein